jgi:hypothetical protein
LAASFALLLTIVLDAYFFFVDTTLFVSLVFQQPNNITPLKLVVTAGNALLVMWLMPLKRNLNSLMFLLSL